ncbi:MAG TPA: hypothetical protein VMU30_08005 [Bacteroidota bacterium]|nr:hypothetical protein [Bacteroidota bacterium]
MKKVVAISLLFIYVWLFAGVTIWIHECGDSTTTSLLPFSKDPCGCDDSSNNDMCCKIEVRQFQVTDNQLAAATAIIEKISTVLICDVPVQPSIVMYVEPSAPVAIDTSPPASPSIHIIDCTFLI